MEKVNVYKGQTLFGSGDRPDYFFKIVSGRVRVGRKVYMEGDIVGVAEYFLSLPYEADVMVEEDGSLIRYREDDVISDEEKFNEILKHVVESLNSVISVAPGGEAVKDLKESVNVDGMAELATMEGATTETFEALEEVMTLKKLPYLPDEEEIALGIIEKVKKDVDILRYVLYRIAFVKKFPDSERSPEFLKEAIEIYMDEMDDRYGSKYALKLFLYFYPEHEILREVLLRMVKVLRRSQDPEWFEYLERLVMLFPEEEVNFDEIS